MSRLNFKDILTRVANRVGIQQPTNYQRQSVLLHIYDELIKIHATTEDKRVVTARQTIFDGLPLATAPSVSIYPALGTGYVGVDAGFYKYRFTYKNTLQGESTPVDSETIELVTPADERLWIQNIPTRPHGVDSIEVYRTKANGSVFYLHTSLTTDATAIYDNKNDTELITAYTSRTKYADEAPISFPEDFFVLRQATFYNTEGVVVYSKEAPTEEEFNRYKPSPIQENSGSFRTVVDGTVPFTSPITEENIRYDGTVLFTILDTVPPTFDFKVRFAGYVEWMYIAIPDIDFSDMTENPEMAYAFYDLLATGATVRYNKVRLASAELNEAQVAALTLVVRMDVADYGKSLKTYAGYIKRTSDVHAVRAFNFLNDISMDLGS